MFREQRFFTIIWGRNSFDQNWKINKAVAIVNVGVKLFTQRLTDETKLTALDAQLEVISAMHNNILGSGHFDLSTEKSDIAVGELAFA
jgi:hypothetical protein